MPFWLKIDHSWPLLFWAWAAPELIRSSTRAAMSNCRSAGARGGGGGQWGWSNPSDRQPAPPNPSRPKAAHNPYDACRGSWSPLRRLQIWKVNRSLSSTSMMIAWYPRSRHGWHRRSWPARRVESMCSPRGIRSCHPTQGTMLRSSATTRSIGSKSWSPSRSKPLPATHVQGGMKTQLVLLPTLHSSHSGLC